jgi:hypothetical protein
MRIVAQKSVDVQIKEQNEVRNQARALTGV